jgi:hypothetical protein
MTIELIKSDPDDDEQKRVIRMMSDTRALKRQLSAAQVRSVYPQLEQIRDTLSLMLDKADGKLSR